jgi:hypothetical protein
MFKNKVARFCLRELHVSPVYRFEEGLENVHKNIDTFKSIYDILRKNGNYVVFSEGICVQEKRLQKLRKGTARMAFGAEEAYGIDVHIVPVGVNYTYPAKFREEVLINYDEPFSIKDLKDLYISHPAKALLAFNEKVEEGLKRQVVIVNNSADDDIAEKVLVMSRNNMVFPFFKWLIRSDERLIMEKKVCDRINELSEKDPATLGTLKEKAANYFRLLSENGLKDKNIAWKPDYSMLRYIAVILGFPFFVAGYLSNLLLFLVPRAVCNSKIKDLRFYSSVYIAIGTVLSLIYFPAVVIVSVSLLGWWGLLAGLSVPVLGYLALFYIENFRERAATFRFWLKKARNPEFINGLIAARQEILSYLK